MADNGVLNAAANPAAAPDRSAGAGLFGNPKPAGNVRGQGAGNMNRRTFPPKTATAPNRAVYVLSSL
jgi:hypothetical protein